MATANGAADIERQLRRSEGDLADVAAALAACCSRRSTDCGMAGEQPDFDPLRVALLELERAVTAAQQMAARVRHLAGRVKDGK